jgi:soluble cytochrome b562
VILSDVKRNLNHIVTYHGTQYILSACILRRAETDTLHHKAGQEYYSAELRDMRTGYSLVVVRLDEVEELRNAYKR